MAGIDVPAWRANCVGVDDAVAGGDEDGSGAARRLGFGDPGHRRPDHPGHLHRRVHVDQVHGHHRLEEPDGLDVHLGEHGLVVADVQEPEGPPEPPGHLDRDVGGLGHLDLGQAVAGGHQHAVDDQEIDDVVGHGPVDLRIGTPEVEQERTHPGQGLSATAAVAWPHRRARLTP